METDAVCQECGKTEHFAADSPDQLVEAVAAAGWLITLSPPQRLCPEHAAAQAAAQASVAGAQLGEDGAAPAPPASAPAAPEGV